MAWDELVSQAEDENRRDRDRWIGVYIGVLAVLLAICSMGGGNAAKEATLKTIEASNTWAFFQAKNMRRQLMRVGADDLEMRLISDTTLSESARAAIASKIADYKKLDEALTRDPEKPEGQREGLDQLWEKGKALEVERDHALRQDPYFDYAEAFLQIAIVLASVSIISGGSMLLISSGVFGLFGALLTLNGFTLLVDLPFMS